MELPLGEPLAFIFFVIGFEIHGYICFRGRRPICAQRRVFHVYSFISVICARRRVVAAADEVAMAFATVCSRSYPVTRKGPLR